MALSSDGIQNFKNRFAHFYNKGLMQWFLTGVRSNPKGSKVKEGKENVEDQKKKEFESRLHIKNVED